MKIIAGAMITILVVIILVVSLILVPSKGLYSMTAIVENVSRANDVVTIKDFNGNLWQFSGTEDWEVGDVASCTMFDNCTGEIRDDIIINVRYSGYFGEWE